VATFYASAGHFDRLSALIGDPAHWRALLNLNQDGNGDSPVQSLADFAGQLKLLYGVPFKYLAPDARMLPPESIRFFFVDQNWTDALIDGALSVGRSTQVEVTHDSALMEQLSRAADLPALNSRRKLLKKAPLAVGPEDLVYHGFLLRSAVVSGWPGLEVTAFKMPDCQEQVDLVRMDRLSPEVLICIFQEVFQCVNVHEPKEGVVFGALPVYPSAAAETAGADPIGYSKNLRGLGYGPYTVGEFIRNCDIAVPLRAGSERVVNVSGYKQAMESKLVSLNPPAWDATRDFTAAEYSLEAVQGASQFIFHTENPPATTRATPLRAPDEQNEQKRDDARKLNRFLFGDGIL
jgi:hypothetical protein